MAIKLTSTATQSPTTDGTTVALVPVAGTYHLIVNDKVVGSADPKVDAGLIEKLDEAYADSIAVCIGSFPNGKDYAGTNAPALLIEFESIDSKFEELLNTQPAGWFNYRQSLGGHWVLNPVDPPAKTPEEWLARKASKATRPAAERQQRRGNAIGRRRRA